MAINFGLRLLKICRTKHAEKIKVRYIVLSLESLHANVKFLKAIEEKKAKLKSKREEVERKARRGEIDPMHEHAIQNISQVRATLTFQRFDIFETSF